ncbi:hypothetical protein [Leptolyngbya sp. 'hensonii']|uniref:tetratricopeptide repeat protein n=1 Tax=Leptolyngbya sp. 'hensonii' TaxID=1922337 RepID=UPI0015C53728|nr:hypothetical protein [Leptolyngbya sp. 'hensonii']
MRRSFTIAIAHLALVGAVVGGAGPGLAQDKPAQFPPNPLEMTGPDPLLPNPPVSRPLSPQERRLLSEALDQLNLQAIAAHKAKDNQKAFEIWNRELRLRRALGPLVEVPALGRVGDIAWRESDTTEVRLITERLQKIQQETQSDLLPDPATRLTLKRLLGTAYLQVRGKDQAVGVYQELLTDARQRQDRAAEATALTTIAELHLNWFAYENAATTYRELLQLMSAHPALKVIPYHPPQPMAEKPEQPSQPITVVDVLLKLAYIYEQNRQPAEAILAEQQLVDILRKQKNPTLIPPLQLAIGDNYRSLNQLDKAAESYQLAYTLALSQQQFGYAADGLKKLADLYKTQGQLEAVLRIYQYLLDVERQSYNVYGQLVVYDQMGQVYLSRQDFAQARVAYQQGLALAKQLKYREAYFVEQVNRLTSPP